MNTATGSEEVEAFECTPGSRIRKFGRRLRIASYRSPCCAEELMISSRDRISRRSGATCPGCAPGPVQPSDTSRATDTKRIENRFQGAASVTKTSSRESVATGKNTGRRVVPGGRRLSCMSGCDSRADQQPNDTVHVSGGRRSHMNEPPIVVKFGVLDPGTDFGNTMSVTAEPATV